MLVKLPSRKRRNSHGRKITCQSFCSETSDVFEEVSEIHLQLFADDTVLIEDDRFMFLQLFQSLRRLVLVEEAAVLMVSHVACLQVETMAVAHMQRYLKFN